MAIVIEFDPSRLFQARVKTPIPKGETALAPDKLRFTPFSAEGPSSNGYAPRREHVARHVTHDDNPRIDIDFRGNTLVIWAGSNTLSLLRPTALFYLSLGILLDIGA